MAAKRLSSHWLGAAGSSGPNKRPKFSAPRPPSSNASDSAQFSSSPSTSSLINTHQPETTTHEKAKGTGHAMLSLLKGSMKFLRKGCEMFPPLEATVGTLLEALELIEVSGSAKRGALLNRMPWCLHLSRLRRNVTKSFTRWHLICPNGQ